MKIKISTISDLQAIRCNENDEPLVKVEMACPEVLCDYRRIDSDVNSILVRQSVANKLQKVQRQLSLHDQGMQLLVVEGYRSPVYQERYYMMQLLAEYQKDPLIDFQLLLDHVHQMVALPSVAGHPTGGAIDVTIAYNGQESDMGGNIADFSVPGLLPTYSDLLTPEQVKSRLLLHNAMVAEGFAPFYGEWWHFSYGDREWAAFYEMPETLYSPILR